MDRLIKFARSYHHHHHIGCAVRGFLFLESIFRRMNRSRCFGVPFNLLERISVFYAFHNEQANDRTLLNLIIMFKRRQTQTRRTKKTMNKRKSNQIFEYRLDVFFSSYLLIFKNSNILSMNITFVSCILILIRLYVSLAFSHLFRYGSHFNNI